MNLVVLTPEREVFNGSITSVKVPGVNGQFEILNGHAPIVSSLNKGTVRIVDSNGSTKSFGISQGFVEVLYNEVSLLVQGVEE